MKKIGISLIVLIITIIVLIIIAGAVILTITQNNPLKQTNESVFKNNTITFNEELSTYVAKQIIDTNGVFNRKTFNANSTTTPSIIDAITSMSGEKYNGTLYSDLFEVQNGKLVLKDSAGDANLITWCTDMGIEYVGS